MGRRGGRGAPRAGRHAGDRREGPRTPCSERKPRFEMFGRLVVSTVATAAMPADRRTGDRKSTRLNSSHLVISYAVFCLKKKKNKKPSTSRLSTVIHNNHRTSIQSILHHSIVSTSSIILDVIPPNLLTMVCIPTYRFTTP